MTKDNSLSRINNVSRFVSRNTREAVESFLKANPNKRFSNKEIQKGTGKELRQIQNITRDRKTFKVNYIKENVHLIPKYSLKTSKEHESKGLQKSTKQRIKKAFIELLRQNAYYNSEDMKEEEEIFNMLLNEKNVLQFISDKLYVNEIAIKCKLPISKVKDILPLVANEVMRPECVLIDGEYTPKQKIEERKKYEKMGIKAKFIEYKS
jgi:hypothetical protein